MWLQSQPLILIYGSWALPCLTRQKKPTSKGTVLIAGRFLMTAPAGMSLRQGGCEPLEGPCLSAQKTEALWPGQMELCPNPPWGLPLGLAWSCQGVSPGRRGHSSWGLFLPTRLARQASSPERLLSLGKCVMGSLQGASSFVWAWGCHQGLDSSAGLPSTAPCVCGQSGFRFYPRVLP